LSNSNTGHVHPERTRYPLNRRLGGPTPPLPPIRPHGVEGTALKFYLLQVHSTQFNQNISYQNQMWIKMRLVPNNIMFIFSDISVNATRVWHSWQIYYHKLAGANTPSNVKSTCNSSKKKLFNIRGFWPTSFQLS
jgi:hypothetical protein